MNFYFYLYAVVRACRVLHILAVSMVIVQLGGCATTSDWLQTNPDPLFVSPGTTYVLPPDLKGIDISRTDCEASWLKSQINAIPSDVDRFAAAMSCSLRGDATQHARFVEVGRLLASRQCDVFMDSLEDKRVHTGYNQTNMNTLVAAAAAILAKSGHHAQAIFNLATGAVAANSLVDNYRANYVMTHSLYQLRQKIREGKAALDATVNTNIAQRSYSTFDQAKQDLMDYGDWCTHKTLVYIINTALAETKITAETPEQTLAAKDKQALFDQAKTANDKIKGKAFTDRQFSLLFALSNRASGARTKAIPKLDAIDPVKGATKWEDPLKEADLALIVKALKLDVQAGDANADKIVTVGRIVGYQFGAGKPEADELDAALGVPAAPVAAAPTPVSAPAPAAVAAAKAAKALTVAETRNNLKIRQVRE